MILRWPPARYRRMPTFLVGGARVVWAAPSPAAGIVETVTDMTSEEGDSIVVLLTNGTRGYAMRLDCLNHHPYQTLTVDVIGAQGQFATASVPEEAIPPADVVELPLGGLWIREDDLQINVTPHDV